MPERDRKKDIIWNMLGSLLYALSSMVMAFLVTRAAGLGDGGIFGFGFSTFGQQMFIIAYFGIRPFHITDTAGIYSFGAYRRLRLWTSALALGFSVVYVVLFLATGAYDSIYKGLCILLLAAYKIMDGYADVYESEAQRDGGLYVGGQALFFRTLLSMTGFCIVLLMSRSLLPAALAGAMLQLLGLYVFDIRRFFRTFSAECFSLRLEPGSLVRLLRDTFPLFLSVFLDFYVFSSSRYAIDWFGTDEMSGIFNILFMPTSFIYLAANFIIRPFMTELSDRLDKGDGEGFGLICRRLVLMVTGLSLLCLMGVAILGRPVLTILEMLLGSSYEGVLSGRLGVFFLIIAGGGLYALNNLFYYILIVLRRQRLVFYIYLMGALVAFPLSRGLLGTCGMQGAAISYVILMLLMLAAFSAASRIFMKKTFAKEP